MDNAQEVERALQQLSKEIQILIRASEDPATPVTPELRARFKNLKDRIALGAEIGTVTGDKRELTDSERDFYQPALQNALFYFKASANAAPTKWLDTLLDIQVSIETMMARNSL
ncbi:hypothetical protein KV699_12285 [Vreelandella titanicae]|uniref:hypothetical protein n=1 Tax=Halomonadaceae TaxID=28256 RepID=UPI00059B2F28|nr:hypothetical protein [Halomonas sp. KHS3]KIN12838.1 hypothetical protein RO22_22935 [Halomonas sp. KHS3]